MQNMTIGSLTVHDLSSNGDFWLHSPIEGFESPEYRITEYDKAGEDGGIVSSMLYSSRAITLTGTFVGSSLAQFEHNRRKLIDAVAITRDVYGQPQPVKIAFTTLAGSTYFVSAYFKKPSIVWDQIKWGKFMLQATIPDPFIYAEGLKTTPHIQQASGGGFKSPFQSPFLTTESEGGKANISISGSVASYPILELHGQLTKPYIQNLTTGRHIQLDYTLPAGSNATIDMRNKTIKLNNSSTLLSTKTASSDWWTLNAGNNTIKLSTSNFSDDGYITFEYYNSYAGV